MEYLRYVTEGKERAGSWKELADVLGVPQSNMSKIKNGLRGMDEDQVMRLSLLINVEFVEIMAAQKVDRAHTNEERQLWLPFVRNAHSMHAVVILCICAAAVFETIFVSPLPGDPHLASLYAVIPSLLC